MFVFLEIFTTVGAAADAQAVCTMIFVPPSLPALWAAEFLGFLLGGLRDRRAAIETVIWLDNGRGGGLRGFGGFRFVAIADGFYRIISRAHGSSNISDSVSLLPERENLLLLVFSQKEHP